MKKPEPLPIDPHLTAIAAACRDHSTVLIKASPGSGKTTRVPLELMRTLPGKVLVLEPRRLAAKLAAERISSETGLVLGKEVGYHFRFDRRMEAGTRLVFYTEGTFLKMLLGNPDLADVSAIILDEFHERHLETDLALAFLRSLQDVRKELRLVLMSATLDTALQGFFPDARVIEVEVPRFKVETHHLPNVPSVLGLPLEQKIKMRLEELPETPGDVLVFVPGMREMLRARDSLGERFGEVHLLHSEISKEEQELALGPSRRRKIILATNIAESSVTIPGVTMVIDSGIQRESVHSPWNGLTSLMDRPITQSSAIQRAGRAGRTADGHCFRLYSEHDFREREPFTVPEIMKADLTDTFLTAAEWTSGLRWLQPPPDERWRKARELAYRLGAVDDGGRLTPLGLAMQAFPLGARLSRALVAGKSLVQTQRGQLLSFIVENLEKDRQGHLHRRLTSYLRDPGQAAGPWEKCLLTGFIDQVARLRRKQHDFIHHSGKTLKIHSSLRDLTGDFYLVLDVTSRQEACLVREIEEEWLLEVEPFPFHEEESVRVEDDFRLMRQTKLGSISMDEAEFTPAWGTLTDRTLAKILLQSQRPYEKRLKAWQEGEEYLRLHFWARHKGQDLGTIMEELGPEDFFSSTERLSWEGLEFYLSQEASRRLEVADLERDLPRAINLGGKRELTIHYPFGLDPFVEAPIQDFYGVKETPTIGREKIPLTLKLLGPHKRPLQVTKDIKSFWSKAYREMKRELERDYPRHHWPESPADARPLLLKKHLTGGAP